MRDQCNTFLKNGKKCYIRLDGKGCGAYYLYEDNVRIKKAQTEEWNGLYECSQRTVAKSSGAPLCAYIEDQHVTCPVALGKPENCPLMRRKPGKVKFPEGSPLNSIE